MDIMESIRKRAQAKEARVILAESSDTRVHKAASFLTEHTLCEVVLIGNEQAIRSQAADNEIELSDQLKFVTLSGTDNSEMLIDHLYERRKHKGISKEDAQTALESPLYLGATLVATGWADACVAGSVATTGEVIRAALHSIGLKEDTSIVSSIFLMAMPDGKTLTYGDCGVVPYPDVQQLADIAIQSGQSHKLLTGEEPISAMLSFSTKGSAKHERTELVRKALEIVQQKQPELTIDGELQFDAAFVQEVAERKAPNSKVAGKANVFIFPNLDAGNIAYKITQRLGGATATGPILQGLAKPMMDLSRGCSWQDIVNAACVAILMGDKHSKTQPYKP